VMVESNDARESCAHSKPATYLRGRDRSAQATTDSTTTLLNDMLRQRQRRTRAAAVLQAAVRRRQLNRVIALMLAVLRLQQAAYSYLERDFFPRRRALLRLQSAAYSYLERVFFPQRVQAATAMQAAVRAWLRKRARAATVVQAVGRGHLVRDLICMAKLHAVRQSGMPPLSPTKVFFKLVVAKLVDLSVCERRTRMSLDLRPPACEAGGKKATSARQRRARKRMAQAALPFEIVEDGGVLYRLGPGGLDEADLRRQIRGKAGQRLLDSFFRRAAMPCDDDHP
jgi:hypothetical protein